MTPLGGADALNQAVDQSVMRARLFAGQTVIVTGGFLVDRDAVKAEHGRP